MRQQNLQALLPFLNELELIYWKMFSYQMHMEPAGLPPYLVLVQAGNRLYY